MSRPKKVWPAVPNGCTRCRDCKQVKPDSDFRLNHDINRYFARRNIVRCNDCREKRRQYHARYREDNRDCIAHTRKQRGSQRADWKRLSKFLYTFGARG